MYLNDPLLFLFHVFPTARRRPQKHTRIHFNRSPLRGADYCFSWWSDRKKKGKKREKYRATTSVRKRKYRRVLTGSFGRKLLLLSKSKKGKEHFFFCLHLSTDVHIQILYSGLTSCDGDGGLVPLRPLYFAFFKYSAFVRLLFSFHVSLADSRSSELSAEVPCAEKLTRRRVQGLGV